MSDLLYNVFGSGDSVDYDIMVYLDKLPDTIEECKNLCKEYDKLLTALGYSDKEVNTNLAVLKDGVIVDCFKGISIETNNSIFLTAPHHDQHRPIRVERQLPITNEWKRQKSARALRIILSFLSRTQYRPEVKAALRGSTRLKMSTLLGIDLATIEDFGKNNQCKEDVYKNIAFQIGQARGLLHRYECYELYTKGNIAVYFPPLRPYLYRVEGVSADKLNMEKDRLISEIVQYSMLSDPYDVETIHE